MGFKYGNGLRHDERPRVHEDIVEAIAISDRFQFLFPERPRMPDHTCRQRVEVVTALRY